MVESLFGKIGNLKQDIWDIVLYNMNAGPSGMEPLPSDFMIIERV